MQYFDFLSASQKEDVFFKLPGSVTKDSPKHILEHALELRFMFRGTEKI
jgi:hypothetical protein